MKITAIPQVYRNVNRWGEILTILSKYGLAGWISRFDLPLVKGMLKNRDGEALAHFSRETRIRLAIEELGPTFIKLGPDAQHAARPGRHAARPGAAEAANQRGLRRSASRLRNDRNGARQAARANCSTTSTPRRWPRRRSARRIAARLPSGDDVVVKVQHAGIRRRMEVDLDILAGLANLAERVARAAAVSAAGHGGRVPPRGPPRAGFRPRGPQPAAVRAQLFPLAARAHPAAVSRAVDGARADDGMARRRQAFDPAVRADSGYRPQPGRPARRRNVPGDDLSSRLLPRRSAPGKSHRAARRRDRPVGFRHGRPGSTSRCAKTSRTCWSRSSRRMRSD